MSRVVEYTTRFHGVRSNLVGLPAWARGVVLLAALPGLILISLSILAFLVSILALLLLAVPAYRLMQWMTGAGRSTEASTGGVVVEQGRSYEGGSFDRPGRKRVEATIIDPTVIDPRSEAQTADRAAD